MLVKITGGNRYDPGDEQYGNPSCKPDIDPDEGGAARRAQKYEYPLVYHPCIDGRMWKAEVLRDECANGSGWASNTFLRGDYNPADAAVIDTLIQASRRDVGKFKGDMTHADSRTDGILVFCNSHGNIEGAVCYENKSVFRYADTDDIPHF